MCLHRNTNTWIYVVPMSQKRNWKHIKCKQPIDFLKKLDEKLINVRSSSEESPNVRCSILITGSKICSYGVFIKSDVPCIYHPFLTSVIVLCNNGDNSIIVNLL